MKIYARARKNWFDKRIRKMPIIRSVELQPFVESSREKILLFLGFLRKGVFVGIISAIFPAPFLCAQILMSGGTYPQNFDSLANSGSPTWTDNSTLVGWYASKQVAPNVITAYRADNGNGNAGALYSYGATASMNRSLGCLESGTPGNIAYGLRFTNDTTFGQSNVMISFSAEQWRVANTLTQTLAFSYQIGNGLTNADGANVLTWTNFSALNFAAPITGGTAGALDGTASANQIIFSNVVLTGVEVQPGQELFLRWYLAKPSSGSSHGVAIDNLTVSFQAANGLPPQTNFPVIMAQPQSQAAGENGFAIFSVGATGNPAPAYQWQFNSTNLPGATSSTLALNNLTTNQAGNYSVVVANSAGNTNSISVSLIVTPNSIDATNGEIRILTYNVAGNNTGTETNAADWSTNATQVQAIGRELMYFNPDIITFNEIPVTNGVAQMPDWMKAFLPGYFLATNSIGDTFIQNVIASRFPITRSQSHLAFSSLAPFGYSGSGFTRDLFEAQIAVPNWPLPLHVFVAHLKSTGGGNPQDDADKRAAMASAVSNYFAAVYLAGTNATHPYILDGDMNEDAFFPETQNYASGHPIQRMTAPPTGLQMTIPINPITRTDLTESIQGSLDASFDYILPCPLLFSNIAGSEVFRTDLLASFPSNLFSNDDKTASDHLPVLMVFKNPFDTPFKLLSIARTNQGVTLQWESQNNRNYNIETSSNLFSWTPFATNILTTTANSSFTFTTNNVSDQIKFFRIYRVP
jgi:endonuclease/exonuclease/phosphatase family metal-dependent hydrolase